MKNYTPPERIPTWLLDLPKQGLIGRRQLAKALGVPYSTLVGHIQMNTWPEVAAIEQKLLIKNGVFGYMHKCKYRVVEVRNLLRRLIREANTQPRKG